MKKPVAIAVGITIALCCSGGIIASSIEAAKNAAEESVEPTRDAPKLIDPTKDGSPPPVVKQPKTPRIGGDDIVHVGEDVPAGSYRTTTPVGEGTCYWVKSSDAEGRKIISNGAPQGGRPQVTLTSGQWFTSANCPDWSKQK